jgi:hypothetical protein
MKNLTTLLLLGFITLLSCDDTSTVNNDHTAVGLVEVENRAINGEQWRVTSFTRSSVDHTNLFDGYIFEFDSNNLLTSTNGSDNLSGTWSVKDQKRKENKKSEFDDIGFSIGFTNPTLFEQLSGNWEIVTITDSKIELRNSIRNSQADLITFEKI